MKKYIGILSICLAAVFFPACDAIDLDGLSPVNQILNSPDAISNRQSAQALLNGLYDEVQDGTLVYDGYLALAQLYSDETDFTGTFPSRLEFDNINVFPSNPTNGAVFTDFYDAINVANNVIEIIPGVEDATLTDAVKSDFVGQAKFIRALMYFYLVNYYGEVPLITTPTVEVTNEALQVPASTVAQIYDQIETDLADAEADITTTGTIFATSTAAAALAARVALMRGDNATALTKAEQVISGVDLSSFAYLQDEIFSLGFISTDGNTLNFFYGPAELGARADLLPSQKLLDAYEDGDIRLPLSIDTTLDISETQYVIKYDDFSAGISGTATDPVYFIRYAEVFLIAAEAAAATGDFTKANQYYNAVRTRAGLADNTLDDSNYMDLILQERFVELAFEGPFRWLDLRRTGNTDEIPGYLPCNDVWPIPQNEIDRNPNLAQVGCCNC